MKASTVSMESETKELPPSMITSVGSVTGLSDSERAQLESEKLKLYQQLDDKVGLLRMLSRKVQNSYVISQT